MDFSLSGPIGEPATYWVTPIFPSASILGMKSVGVPTTENASISWSVTAPIAPPKSPLPIMAPILDPVSGASPCLSSTGGGDPAAMNATTIFAAPSALFASSSMEQQVYAAMSMLARVFPCSSAPAFMSGTAASKSFGLDALISAPFEYPPAVLSIIGPCAPM